MDPISIAQQTADRKLADEYAQPGTLKHYLLRKGFMPHDESQAEKILDRIIEEWERLSPA